MSDPAGQAVARLRMLASALSGRDLAVEDAAPGEPAWTNGSVIHLDAGDAFDLQLQQLCVQSALLAAGSLEQELVRKLARRPRVCRRYLAIEGHRALAALEQFLPPPVHALTDRALASRSNSPAASLALALDREPLADPPRVFGTIRPRELLARSSATAAAGSQAARRQPQRPLAELPADAEQGEDTEDFATSPVSGGGGLGRLLQKLFQQLRRLTDGGPPGADAMTHWSRSRPRFAVASLASTLAAESVADAFGRGRGTLYPEWDVHRRRYRPDWCTVKETDPPADRHATVAWLEGHDLRRPLARLGLGLDRFRRRAQGDDIDLDAAIEARLRLLSGATPDEAVYVESLRHRRDLSVLILLDISGSVTQASPAGGLVHEQQRGVAAALTTVLYEIGDRVALYAFHSQGRHAVDLVPLKRFEENLDSRVMRRLHSLEPGAYSRLGAAIRHGASLLIDRGGTARRLLLVLSDGLAFDHGYDPAYGAADARQALAEARRDGVACVCLSVGANTDTDSLRRVFGSAAHANIPRPAQLGPCIGPLVRSALRNAEVRRRLAAAANTSITTGELQA
jgi:hypothetical protein